MKKMTLRLQPYHTFLVVPFIVLFMYQHNMGQASFAMTWRTLLIGFAGSTLLYGVFYLFYKNRLKTGVFVTMLIFGMFQYGVVYEFFETLYYAGRWPFDNIHRYLLSVYFLILLGLFLVIRLIRHDFIKINFFLNLLLFLLIVFNGLMIASGNTKELVKNNEAPVSDHHVSFSKDSVKPNIYYIILDGYGSSAVLKKYYAFNNSEFEQSLKSLGFVFAQDAFANHYYTSQSLGATLNMSLNSDTARLSRVLYNNKVMQVLKDNGYGIYFLKSGYAVTSRFAAADSTIYIKGPNEFEKSVLRHTILRLDDLVGFFARKRLQSQLERMYDFPEIKRNPKFCFIHFVAPHPPYVFDRDGNVRASHRFTEHSWEPKEAYIDQLIYMNKMITGLIKKIKEKDPGALIMLQSDHGPWVSADSPTDIFEARSGILYAYYSTKDLKIPSKTSPVNTFRYIFNGCFNTGLRLESDSMAGKQSLMLDPILVKKVHEH